MVIFNLAVFVACGIIDYSLWLGQWFQWLRRMDLENRFECLALLMMYWCIYVSNLLPVKHLYSYVYVYACIRMLVSWNQMRGYGNGETGADSGMSGYPNRMWMHCHGVIMTLTESASDRCLEVFPRMLGFEYDKGRHMYLCWLMDIILYFIFCCFLCQAYKLCVSCFLVL